MNNKTVRSSATIEGKVILVLNENEARALEAIVGYGPDKFIEWFYKNQGKYYLQPHENAMRQLFETIRSELPRHLSKFDDARAVFDGKKEAVTRFYKKEISTTQP